MIVVFAEFAGQRLLEKARELADSLGLRVLAVCSSETGTEEFTQKLISLGADEVLKYKDVKTIFDWSETLSSLVKDRQRNVRLLLGISGLYTDAIFGRVYARSKDEMESFATGIDSLRENDSAKVLHSWGAILHFKVSEEKTSIFSFKPTSIPTPFEDTSRYGKTTEISSKLSESGKISPNAGGIKPQEYYDESGILTVLVGQNLARRETELKEVQRIASKYKGKLVEQSSKVQEVYGPCLAIDLQGWQRREMPTFHLELIAIANSRNQIISKIADTSSVTNELPKVLEKL